MPRASESGVLNPGRSLALWAVAALAACLTLAGMLVWRQRHIRTRWSVVQVGDWQRGSDLFFNRKGCGQCHSVNGIGSRLAPDLGARIAPHSGLGQLVTAMWNHAPQIWARMESRKMAYPAIDQEDMAHLLAFLYVEQCADVPGDARLGQEVFVAKKCGACHAMEAAERKTGPLLSAAGAVTPVRWAGIMWSHTARMQPLMKEAGLSWPEFQGREMVDLYAYVREAARRSSPDAGLPLPNPEQGWKVFQSRSCVACHSVRGEGGNAGPPLGPERQTPVGLLKLAGLMWSHSPEMLRKSAATKTAFPTLDGQDLADLSAFLLSLHYSEPAGSALVGKTLFAARGCSRCHGADGSGSRLGPRLRGRAERFSSVALAASLWRHGRAMYAKTKEAGLAWPALAETDVGNLMSFLNQSPD